MNASQATASATPVMVPPGSLTLVTGHLSPGTQETGAGDEPLDPDQRSSESQTCDVGVDSLVTDRSITGAHACGVGDDALPADHTCSDPQARCVGGQVLGLDHQASDNQRFSVEVDPLATDHTPNAAQGFRVGGDHLSQPSTIDDSASLRAASTGWLELRIWAEMLHDAQQARIAATNRAERGGVDPMLYGAYLDTLNVAEHQCKLALRRCYRRVVPESIREWEKASKGVGIDRLARLLGHLGHPRIATPHHWEGTGANRTLIADEPYERTVSQLWQYCGVGRPERKRKGMTADELAAQGNPTLKPQIWLASVECMKCMASPYRLLYDDAREAYADKLHSAECVRCGPSGKPAIEGSPWSPGHQHAAALRKVGKEILRDLWRAAA